MLDMSRLCGFRAPGARSGAIERGYHLPTHFLSKLHRDSVSYLPHSLTP